MRLSSMACQRQHVSVPQRSAVQPSQLPHPRHSGQCKQHQALDSMFYAHQLTKHLLHWHPCRCARCWYTATPGSQVGAIFNALCHSSLLHYFLCCFSSYCFAALFLLQIVSTCPRFILPPSLFTPCLPSCMSFLLASLSNGGVLCACIECSAHRWS